MDKLPIANEDNNNSFSLLINSLKDLNSPIKLIYNISKYGADYFEKKRNDRIVEFHTQLIQGIADKDKIKYEDEYIKTTEEDYFGILSAAINDEEKEKVSIYVNLYDNVLRGNLKEYNKLRYLLLAKNIPISAFQILSKIYLFRKFKYLEMTLEDYLYFIHKNNMYEINILIHHNILMEKSISTSSEKNVPFAINDSEFEKVISFFFNEYDLGFEKNGIKEIREEFLIISDSLEKTEINTLISFFDKSKINPIRGGGFNNTINGGTPCGQYSQRIIDALFPKRFFNFLYLFEKEALTEDRILKLRATIIPAIKHLEEDLNINPTIIKVTFHKETVDPIPDIGEELIYLDDEKKINTFIDTLITKEYS